jgi:hypothetical protein
VRTVHALRAAVTVLLLLLTAAAGTATATGFLVLAEALGGLDGWGELLRDLFLTGAGLAALCAVPAVVALWLRARHPVASGTVATLMGAVAVGVCGPQAAGSGSASLVAWAGLVLMVCAVPLPAPAAGARFGA